MNPNLEFLAAFGFLQVKEGNCAISMHSISQIELLEDGQAVITTIAGGQYTLSPDLFTRYKEHCEGLLSQYVNAQPSRLVVPGRRVH